jgi:hypothetical protein
LRRADSDRDRAGNAIGARQRPVEEEDRQALECDDDDSRGQQRRQPGNIRRGEGERGTERRGQDENDQREGDANRSTGRSVVMEAASVRPTKQDAEEIPILLQIPLKFKVEVTTEDTEEDEEGNEAGKKLEFPTTIAMYKDSQITSIAHRTREWAAAQSFEVQKLVVTCDAGTKCIQSDTWTMGAHLATTRRTWEQLATAPLQPWTVTMSVTPFN